MDSNVCTECVAVSEKLHAVKASLDTQPGLTDAVKTAYDALAADVIALCRAVLGPPVEEQNDGSVTSPTPG